MPLNASLPLLKPSAVDVDAIMDNFSIVLYSLIVTLGVSGNSLVIWVAGFKLKVGLRAG